MENMLFFFALGLRYPGFLCAFCWVFRVQGFHNRLKWSDALVVKPGPWVCFALMALSHNPASSLEMLCSALGLTSAWTYSLYFHLFFFHVGRFCFHRIGPASLEMPGSFGICWNHLWLFLFMSARPRLHFNQVSLICGSSSVFGLTVSFCAWTPPTVKPLFVVILIPKSRTEFRKYKEHVSTSQFFIHLSLTMAMFIQSLNYFGPDWNIWIVICIFLRM